MTFLRTALTSCLILALLSACSSAGKPADGTVFAFETANGEMLQPDTARLRVASVEPLVLSDNVRQMLNEHIDPKAPPRALVADITSLIINESYLGVDYDSSVTGTALDVSRTGVANCLGFSHLFVAMAREVGLDASYQQVEIKPQWQKQQDWLVVGRHISVVGSISRRRTYNADIDYTSRYRSLNKYPISDASALAQHYNNLAMDALLASDMETSYAYLVRALETDDNQPHIWTNLGTLYKKNGQWSAAEQSYQHALSQDASYHIAAHHLARFYESNGQQALAERYYQKVRLYRDGNPYYHAWLASTAASEGQLKKAVQYLEEAIAIKPDEFDFYLAAFEYELRLGREMQAQSHYERADALAKGRQKLALSKVQEALAQEP